MVEESLHLSNVQLRTVHHSVQCRAVEKSAEHYKEEVVVHCTVERRAVLKEGRGGGSREMVDRQH